ncbi:MAG: glycosyltransferase family 2 protein [Okeania sp. SIO3C4]|nr:glycosyltransferase family 2 protein [Okeania sp. SIO3C4]
MNSKYLSFVIPVYNEKATIKPLFERILDVMNLAEINSYEIIFVDDGSNDLSWIEINELIKKHPQKIKGIRLRRNFGKSSALSAGFKKATGNIIFTLDADLQDDPAEVPKFLEKLESGYDLVSGWRKHRNDPFSKTLPSKLFNGVTSILTGVKLHDFNCGLKAYKKEVLDCIKVYGELHRYIPVLAHSLGFKISEVTVRHHQRKQGKSKYGLERYTRGFLDLLTVLATTNYLHKPGHLFGSLGLLFGALGMTSLGYLTILWFMEIRPIGTRPLFLFGILCIILSVQLISLGILAELITRNVDDDYVDKQICEVVEIKE